MNEKLISVCINAYNAEATIEKTLHSVLEQTYPHLQVIVVDDASTDRTPALLRAICDERVEVYTLLHNSGISAANNEAIAHATGDYIAHIDADDRWHPQKIQKQLDFMEAHPAVGCCFTWADMVDENGQKTDSDFFHFSDRSRSEMLRFFFENGNRLCHSSMFARRELFGRVGLHNMTMSYNHDFDLWLRMLAEAPLAVIEEVLVDYLFHTQGHSRMQQERTNAHNEEYVRMWESFCEKCPDELFLQAMRDRLRLQGEHTAEETALEKAFLMMEAMTPLPLNPVIGMNMLARLMEQEPYRLLAAEKFDFTIQDFYRLQRKTVYHDGVRAGQMKMEIEKRDMELAELRTCLQNEQAARQAVEAHLHAVMSSGSWRLGGPLRRVKRLLTRKKQDNTAPACSQAPQAPVRQLALYGFFGHNLGDDLFLARLLERYPQVKFHVLATPDYKNFFARFSNTVFYADNDPSVMAYQLELEKQGIHNGFERKLTELCDGTVHIGGSIYQQIGDWQRDKTVRENRFAPGKAFFSVSSNFGPYQTEDYRQYWHDRFADWTDICFRDRYSYQLFSDLSSVRYAPDLLFSQPMPQTEVLPNRVAISVFEADLPMRPFTDAEKQAYERVMREAVLYLLQRGYSVELLGFCALEQDEKMVMRLKNSVPGFYSDRLSALCYYDDADAVLRSIASASYVLATRFHASVLGMVAGKRVLPVCYSDKITHVLDDMGFDGRRVSMREMPSLSGSAVAQMLLNAKAFDASAFRVQATEQFAALDRFVNE